MEVVKEICAVMLIIIIVCLVCDWITLPYKIDKTNDLLKDILKQLKGDSNVSK